MIYLAYWCICSICTFSLGKSYIENLIRPFGGLPSVCRKIWLEDEENSYEDKWALENMPDAFIAAILWTLLLIICMAAWPVVVLLILYGKVTGYRVTKEDLH